MNYLPLVSVILPVYNAEKYLEQAIDSILQQSFHQFEFIIINDGSTDHSQSIIESKASVDNRIKVISRENKGLIYTLNQAISLSKGDYIVRMDADDIALTDRIEKQLCYLKSHPDVAVLGTGYRFMDEGGSITGTRRVMTSFEDIKASFYFGNPIAHPSVMVNYKLLGNDYVYLEQYKTVEDFELWCRISKHYKIENLPDVLLHYRVLESSVSGKNLSYQVNAAAEVLAKLNGFNELEKSLSIAMSTYNYSINQANYIQLLKACFILNWDNSKHRQVNPINLFKRTILALLSASRKNLRS